MKEDGQAMVQPRKGYDPMLMQDALTMLWLTVRIDSVCLVDHKSLEIAPGGKRGERDRYPISEFPERRYSI